MTSKQEYIKKLRNSSLRPTKQRLNICEVLFNREKTFHFTISDLFNLIKDKTGAVSYTHLTLPTIDPV